MRIRIITELKSLSCSSWGYLSNSSIPRHPKTSLAGDSWQWGCEICIPCFSISMYVFLHSKAAEYAAAMVKKNERTVRRWRSGLIKNKGILPESQQVHYQQSGVLWKNKELNKKAREYVQANAAIKGRPNLTAPVFCRWVDESLLPNTTLEPGFPWKVGLETARLWLHHLGFEVLTVQKGVFIDGHEREDVVESRKLFLRKMTKLGFLHFTNAPTEETMRAVPDVDAPTNEQRLKTVVFFTMSPYSTQIQSTQCQSNSVYAMGNEGRENDEAQK